MTDHNVGMITDGRSDEMLINGNQCACGESASRRQKSESFNDPMLCKSIMKLLAGSLRPVCAAGGKYSVDQIPARVMRNNCNMIAAAEAIADCPGILWLRNSNHSRTRIRNSQEALQIYPVHILVRSPWEKKEGCVIATAYRGESHSSKIVIYGRRPRLY